MALDIEAKPEAIVTSWDLVMHRRAEPPQVIAPGAPARDVFRQINEGRLNESMLILGDPGSGKTTTLLELARETIAAAVADAKKPLPVVFNLSLWGAEREPLAAWLVTELRTKYQIPRTIAQQWVDKDKERLLVLLDGLDEVALEHRDACIAAINAYREEGWGPPLVVCSRGADYAALTAQLRLNGTVALHPLGETQVKQYLAGAGERMAAVRAALADDETLQALARSPLMLEVMMVAYAD